MRIKNTKVNADVRALLSRIKKYITEAMIIDTIFIIMDDSFTKQITSIKKIGVKKSPNLFGFSKFIINESV